MKMYSACFGRNNEGVLGIKKHFPMSPCRPELFVTQRSEVEESGVETSLHVLSLVFVFIGVFFGSIHTYAQSFAVQAEQMNIAYIDVNNPLTIVSEGYNCDQITASCDNGTLTSEGGCHYNLLPKQHGTCDIVVSAKTKTGTKIIGRVKYRVKYIPRPVASIAGKSDGRVATAAFKAQSGISVYADGFDFDFRIGVMSFDVEFYRSGEVLYSGHNPEASFTENTRKQIKNLKPGDKVTFSSIACTSSGSRIFQVNDINLILN